MVEEPITNPLKDSSNYITFDNGLEVTKTQELETKSSKIYYAFPYSPWQRGINEN